MTKTKKITLCAMFIALNIICARFLFIYTPGGLDRVSPSFLADALCGFTLGPIWGLLYAVAADILGMLLNSAGLSFNPMFTGIAALRGLLYGVFLYKKNLTLPRIAITFVAITLIVDLCLNPLALMIYYGKAFFPIVLAKLPVQLIFSAVKIAALFALRKPFEKITQIGTK